MAPSEVHTASIMRVKIEAVRTSETSGHSNETTRRYIPVDSKLHTRRRESLKSQTEDLYYGKRVK
jgi:hypothetical protein